VPNEELFQPPAPVFAKFSSDIFKFVLGKAESLRPDYTVVEAVVKNSSQRTILYD
jgi:hypothetical protein